MFFCRENAAEGRNMMNYIKKSQDAAFDAAVLCCVARVYELAIVARESHHDGAMFRDIMLTAIERARPALRELPDCP